MNGWSRLLRHLQNNILGAVATFSDHQATTLRAQRKNRDMHTQMNNEHLGEGFAFLCVYARHRDIRRKEEEEKDVDAEAEPAKRCP